MRVAKGLGVALVLPLLFVLTRCSNVTEIVVAVDTDLTPGQDFDRVEVRVQTDTLNQTKGGDVRAPTALPVTLGVTAGNNTSAPVLVEATALKEGAPVARTTVTAVMVDGHSKLLHVSLCRSCPPGAQCGRGFGTSMPEFANDLPGRHECAGVFADAGGFDAATPADGGPAATDASVDADAASASCSLSCPQNTSCRFNACELSGNAACNAPIVVEGTVTLRGKVCPPNGQQFDFVAPCGTDHPTHADIFSLGDGTYKISLRPLGSNWVVLRGTNSDCNGVLGVPGCSTAKSPSAPVGTSATGPIRLAVGGDKNLCTEYEVTFTKQ